ncbi:MAG: hypothetical protein NC206_01565 [Bacteroides sp.]|nr:hypothetical protein [Roseburia sp.]MCM1345758.1 hypothetical protein [Bacteroides sp.]MCM1420147.1 hypothetical protein [Bacteroides sp.]
MIYRLIVILAFALNVAVVYAKSDATSGPAVSLTDMGFENVRVEVADGVVFAAVEAAAYRGTFRGAGVALKKLAADYPDVRDFELVLLEYKVPEIHVHAVRENEAWAVDVDYAVENVMERLRLTEQTGSSTGKVDVTFYPIVSVDNHRLDKLCEYVVSLAPSFETTLWKGNRVTVQPIFPLAWNVAKGSSDSYVHLGVASLQQRFLNTDKWYLDMAGGFFQYDKIGVHAKLGYRTTENLSLSLQLGLTGDAFVDADGYDISKPDRFNFMLKADYYEPNTRLQCSLAAGRFVYGDYGARLDCTRHFGEYAIGLYGVLTGGEHNAGFHFAIPFGGRSQKRKGALRLRLPEYFDWEYSMVSYFKYSFERMGQEYEERPDKNRSAHYWQARYVEQYLQKFLDGQIK